MSEETDGRLTNQEMIFYLRLSIVELAECIKEIARMRDWIANSNNQQFQDRMEKVYNKASKAKNRIDVK